MRFLRYSLPFATTASHRLDIVATLVFCSSGVGKTTFRGKSIGEALKSRSSGKSVPFGEVVVTEGMAIASQPDKLGLIRVEVFHPQFCGIWMRGHGQLWRQQN